MKLFPKFFLLCSLVLSPGCSLVDDIVDAGRSLGAPTPRFDYMERRLQKEGLPGCEVHLLDGTPPEVAKYKLLQLIPKSDLGHGQSSLFVQVVLESNGARVSCECRSYEDFLSVAGEGKPLPEAWNNYPIHRCLRGPKENYQRYDLLLTCGNSRRQGAQYKNGRLDLLCE